MLSNVHDNDHHDHRGEHPEILMASCVAFVGFAVRAVWT